MCTKFLGDGLCCGWDCYVEPTYEGVEADFGAFESYLDEAERALWVATGIEESEADADLADRATDMPRWDGD